MDSLVNTQTTTGDLIRFGKVAASIFEQKKPQSGGFPNYPPPITGLLSDVGEVQETRMGLERYYHSPGQAIMGQTIFIDGPILSDSVHPIWISLYLARHIGHKEMQIFFNTPGGQVAAGLAIIDAIHWAQGEGMKITGIVAGNAWSMGAVVLQACNPRLVMPHATLMVHGMSGGGSGDAREKRMWQKLENTYMDYCAELLASRSHKDVSYWRPRMEDTIGEFYVGAESIEEGLADAIIGQEG